MVQRTLLSITTLLAALFLTLSCAGGTSQEEVDALFTAVTTCDADKVEALLEEGVPADVRNVTSPVPEYQSWTPLHFAVVSYNIKKELTDRMRAYYNATNKAGKDDDQKRANVITAYGTRLEELIATYGGVLPWIKTNYTAGNIEMTMKAQTVVYLSDFRQIATLLIEKGNADVNATNGKGESPLSLVNDDTFASYLRETKPATQKNDVSDQGDEGTHPRTWYIAGMSAEPVTLNPVSSSGAYASRVNGFIFCGLVTINSNLEPIPDLAERWEISDDHLTYTFYLRKDARWHDGTPVTAHDVLFTYNKIIDPASKAMNKRVKFTDVEKAEVVDDYTFRVRYKKPFVPALLSWGTLIIPKHIYSKGDFLKDHNRTPVGCGPYTLEEWKTGQHITLAKVSNHWRDNPAIEKIKYKFIKESSVSLNAYKKGELDSVGMLPDHWVREKDNPRIKNKSQLLAYYSLGFGYIGWNMDGSNPFFTNKNVRKAMTYATPRKAVIEHALHGYAKTLTGPYHPDVWAYDRSIEPYPTDLKEASRLLKNAGWIDSDSDGVLDKMIDGERVPFRFEILFGQGSEVGKEMLLVLQENLKKVGVEVVLHAVEWSAFTTKIHSKNFDACLLGWSLDTDPDPTDLFHSREIAEGLNYYSYSNAQVDELCDKGRVTFNQEERKHIYFEVHRILHEEQPYTFLWASQSLVAIHKRFGNVTPSPVGIISYYPGLYAWTIKE